MNTPTPAIKPQDSRLFALLIAFISSAVDALSHVQFHSLVATQTGNIVMMVGDLMEGDWGDFLSKADSIAFFSLGFFSRD